MKKLLLLLIVLAAGAYGFFMKTGTGQNMLGRTLMAVREELRRARIETGSRG